MPLLKRKPYSLSKRPKGLEPNEQVFKVRITGEVFREYEDYIGRVNLYRQRVWTCKATGKTNLTYEEALLSEQRANEKIQQFPKAYVKPVLEMIQFSQARLDDLVDTIFKTFKDRFVKGEEVGLKKDEGALIRVRILRVLENDRYEVGWIAETSGAEEEYCDTTVEGMDTLERKKYPLQKSLLKTFVRDSATIGLTKNAPLVVHEKLARKYGIATEPPEDLKELLSPKGKTKGGDKTAEKDAKLKRKLDEQDAKALAKEAKRAKREEDKEQAREEKRKVKAEEEEQKRIEDELKRIKYPIEDTEVQLGPSEKPPGPRPVPTRDFAVPHELVGSLLMVWDFLMSFSKQVKLSPFALEDLEAALLYREGEVAMLAEVHYALMRVCLDDADHYDRLSKRSKRATQLSLESWSEDLCNYIEARNEAREEEEEASEEDESSEAEPSEVDASEKEQGTPRQKKEKGPETPGPSPKNDESFAECISALQRDHYWDEIDVWKKVALLAALVDHAVQTEIIRGQLDQNWDDLQQLKARKREEDAEWRKQQREQKARARAEGIEQQGTTEGDGEIVLEEENGAAGSDDEQEENGDEEEEDAGEGEEGAGAANGVSNGRGGSPSSSTNSALAGMSRAQARLFLLQQKAADRERAEEGRRAQYEEQRRAQREKAKEAAAVTAERKKREQEEAERQKREEQYEREFDKYFVRRKPLGLDKDHNRYWHFPRESRLFVESEDSATWGYYQAKEELDALFTSLNPKGVRERGLQRAIERHYSKISTALSKRSRELSQKLALDEAAIRRSSRVKSAPRAAPFLSYVNKYTSGY